MVFIALGYTAWQLSKEGVRNKVAALKRYSNWLIALALWQFFTGVTNAVMGWPLFAALAHTAGAAALVMAMMWILCRSTVDSTLNFALQHRPLLKP